MFKKWYRLYIKRPFYAMKFSRPFWFFLNRKSRSLHEKKSVPLDTVQQRIVEELYREGISITTIQELFGDKPEFLFDIEKRLEKMIVEAKQDPKKIHFKNLWDTRSFFLDIKNGFVQFALSSKVVQIANAYMKMWTRLHLANAYISEVRDPTFEKVQTQNWHRDAHDKQLVVIFLYLSDVDTPEAGAFWYIRQSHVFGKFVNVFPQPTPHSLKIFPDERSVENMIPSEYKKVCLGKKGTIIFTDGTGIHRGGHSTADKRIVFLSAYASDNRFSKTTRIAYPEDVSELKSTLTEEGVYAAGLERC